MTVSDFVPYLPLVGAILGGFVGAWANGWYRDRQEKKAQDQERGGLLRLLDTEVYWNNMFLERDDTTYDEIIRRFRKDVWEETRVELAKLLPPMFFSDIVVYYALLDTKIYHFGCRVGQAGQMDVLDEQDKAGCREILQIGKDIRKQAGPYMFDSQE